MYAEFAVWMLVMVDVLVVSGAFIVPIDPANKKRFPNTTPAPLVVIEPMVGDCAFWGPVINCTGQPEHPTVLFISIELPAWMMTFPGCVLTGPEMVRLPAVENVK